jgi:hypothetical protein
MSKTSYNMEIPDFGSLSVILPVMDETESLEKTVATIEADCGDAVKEYLVVVCGRTAPASRAVIESLRGRIGPRVRVIEQKLPFLGGACRDAFDAAAGTHTLMMASDLETPPDRVKAFVDMARRHPADITTGSRWIAGGGFAGYSRLKFFLNWMFQRLFSLLYRTRLSDMTYGYRVFPTALVQAIRWEELRHPFLFETVLKPLRLGVPVHEIPAEWRARTQGASTNTFWRNFVYFRTGFKTLFYGREKILKNPAGPAPQESA